MDSSEKPRFPVLAVVLGAAMVAAGVWTGVSIAVRARGRAAESVTYQLAEHPWPRETQPTPAWQYSRPGCEERGDCWYFDPASAGQGFLGCPGDYKPFLYNPVRRTWVRVPSHSEIPHDKVYEQSLIVCLWPPVWAPEDGSEVAPFAEAMEYWETPPEIYRKRHGVLPSPPRGASR